MSLPTRKLLVGLGTAGAVAVGFGATVNPASAEQRSYEVRLLGGAVVTLQSDAPLTVDSPVVKALGAVVSVTEVGAASPSTTSAAPASTATAPSTSTGTTPSPSSSTTQETAPTRTEAEEADEDEGSSTKGERRKEKSSSREKSSSSKKRRRKSSNSSAGGNASTASSSASRGTAAPAPRTAGGAPTPADPSFSESLPSPTADGVPNFFIDKFRIPPFLLPIYQAAGIQYGVRWEILAGINEIETDYGRNLNVSSAGAQGWMQFMPATWKAYGVDANGDGRKDPYNPVDAIFGAARYLRAAGADKDLRKAIFAYNHADWYVNSVMMRARLVAGLPTDLVGSLSGLTQAQFPVYAKARYADAVKKGDRVEKGENAAQAVESEGSRRSIDVFADAGSPVIAVQDGRVTRTGESEKLGRYVEIRDVYGNTYRYSQLGSVATMHAVPKEREVSRRQLAKELDLPKDPKPERAASAGSQQRAVARADRTAKPAARRAAPRVATRATARRQLLATDRAMPGKERLFADPARTTARPAADAAPAEGRSTEIAGPARGLERYIVRPGSLRQEDVVLKRLRKGSRVVAGTVLGRIGEQESGDPRLRFEIRPAGRGAPRIDPKPILDGWKLLETSATYRSKGKNLFFGGDGDEPSVGQILLMSKEQLQRRVLANPRVDIYECGRRSISSGAIDRRVLATIEFLSASGLRPTISSLQCGRQGVPTASGNVSEHSTGTALDIAKINGQVISPGTQGRGSITEVTIRKLLTLQGTMKPHQIISLMQFKGEDNTLAMGDHDDHIHVGFRPEVAGGKRLGRQVDAILKPGQWIKLVDRLDDIDNPTVRSGPSSSSLKVGSGD